MLHSTTVSDISAATAEVHGCPMCGMTDCHVYLHFQACYCVNEAGIASLQLAHLHLQALQRTKAVMNAVSISEHWSTKYTTLHLAQGS